MTNLPGSKSASIRTKSRTAVNFAVAALMTTTWVMGTAASYAQSVDLSQWSPDYIKSIAGTAEFDTAADCAKVVPLDYKGKLTIWWTGPTDASPEPRRLVASTKLSITTISRA